MNIDETFREPTNRLAGKYMYKQTIISDDF